MNNTSHLSKLLSLYHDMNRGIGQVISCLWNTRILSGDGEFKRSWL